MSTTPRSSTPAPVGRALMAVLVGGLATVLTTTPASAQPVACTYDVSRDVLLLPNPRQAQFTLDGLLATRFALGLRGPALYERLSTESNRFVAEANLGSSIAQLDVDGDGVFTSTDAIAVARYLAGMRGNALVANLSFNPAATRRTGADIAAWINSGCQSPLPTASPAKHAARLLQQGTWGATLAEINRVASFGSDAATISNAWLNEQFAKPQSLYAPYSQQIIDENKTATFDWRCTGANKSGGCAYAANTPAFYKRAMEADDQLRQRVTNALWQTLVVSIANNSVLDAGVGLSSYWDMLSGNLFANHTTNAAGQTVGNFRKTLRDMTLHPAMGIYLDMLGSTQQAPNENYARELLQLFSVGTVMLNLDGTPTLDGNGKTIPTYGEDTVRGFARALTGWHWAGSSGDAMRDPNNNQSWRSWWFYYYPNRDWTQPMEPWQMRLCPQNGRWPPGTPSDAPTQGQPGPCWGWCNIRFDACSLPAPHERGAKTLLQYANAPYATLAANPAPVYPSGTDYTTPSIRNEVISAAQFDLERTVDNVFYHPNVGPFLARQLIQRLITSNPTPGYVQRVAARFNDNGSGVRGDMRAVVRAIFTDSEARDLSSAAKPWFGKLREPVVKFLQMHRAFNARETQEGFYDTWDLSGADTLGQGAMRPPSVFNYYAPDFSPSGPLAYPLMRPLATGEGFGSRSAEPLFGPEFEITNTSTIAGFSDFWGWGVYGGFGGSYSGNGQTRSLRWTPDYSRYLSGGAPLADNPQAMVDELDLLLTAGNLKPAFKANLVAMANGIVRTGNLNDQREQRFRAVFWQIVNSADYAIQR